MTRIFCDTNLLLYLNFPDLPQHSQAVNLIEQFTTTKTIAVITPLIVNEFHYILTKNSGVNKAHQSLNTLLQLPALQLENFTHTKKSLLEVSQLAVTYRLKTSDAFHAYFCKKQKIKTIATFDTDFQKIPWLKTIPN